MPGSTFSVFSPLGYSFLFRMASIIRSVVNLPNSGITSLTNSASTLTSEKTTLEI